MAVNATPANIYPLSTASGIAIPLDAARPKGNVHINLAKNGVLALTLPDEINLITCYFDNDIDLWTQAPTGLVVNTYQPGLMSLMAGAAYDLVVPQNIWLVAHHEATIGQLNVLEIWAQLQNTGNYGVS